MSPSSALTPKVIQTLQNYGACDISDALVALKIPGAGFLPDLTPYCIPTSDSPSNIIVAPASTVLFIPKDHDGSGYHPNNIPQGKHWVDLTESGTFVVESQPEGQNNAVLGGIMGVRMKKLGAVGVVVRGRIRDIEELEETGLMIWAKATSTVGMGVESKVQAINIPITISSVTITPGDFVFSDPANGVVIIPQSKLQEVLELLPRLVESDGHIKEAVMNGMTVQEAFKKYRHGLR